MSKKRRKETSCSVPEHPKHCPQCLEDRGIHSRVKVYHLNKDNDALFLCSNQDCSWPLLSHEPSQILGKSDYVAKIRHKKSKKAKKERDSPGPGSPLDLQFFSIPSLISPLHPSCSPLYKSPRSNGINDNKSSHLYPPGISPQHSSPKKRKTGESEASEFKSPAHPWSSPRYSYHSPLRQTKEDTKASENSPLREEFKSPAHPWSSLHPIHCSSKGQMRKDEQDASDSNNTFEQPREEFKSPAVPWSSPSPMHCSPNRQPRSEGACESNDTFCRPPDEFTSSCKSPKPLNCSPKKQNMTDKAPQSNEIVSSSQEVFTSPSRSDSSLPPMSCSPKRQEDFDNLDASSPMQEEFESPVHSFSSPQTTINCSSNGPTLSLKVPPNNPYTVHPCSTSQPIINCSTKGQTQVGKPPLDNPDPSSLCGEDFNSPVRSCLSPLPMNCSTKGDKPPPDNFGASSPIREVFKSPKHQSSLLENSYHKVIHDRKESSLSKSLSKGRDEYSLQIPLTGNEESIKACGGGADNGSPSDVIESSEHLEYLGRRENGDNLLSKGDVFKRSQKDRFEVSEDDESYEGLCEVPNQQDDEEEGISNEHVLHSEEEGSNSALFKDCNLKTKSPNLLSVPVKLKGSEFNSTLSNHCASKPKLPVISISSSPTKINEKESNSTFLKDCNSKLKSPMKSTNIIKENERSSVILKDSNSKPKLFMNSALNINENERPLMLIKDRDSTSPLCSKLLSPVKINDLNSSILNTISSKDSQQPNHEPTSVLVQDVHDMTNPKNSSQVSKRNEVNGDPDKEASASQPPSLLPQPRATSPPAIITDKPSRRMLANHSMHETSPSLPLTSQEESLKSASSSDSSSMVSTFEIRIPITSTTSIYGIDMPKEAPNSNNHSMIDPSCVSNEMASKGDVSETSSIINETGSLISLKNNAQRSSPFKMTTRSSKKIKNKNTLSDNSKSRLRTSDQSKNGPMLGSFIKLDSLSNQVSMDIGQTINVQVLSLPPPDLKKKVETLKSNILRPKDKVEEFGELMKSAPSYDKSQEFLRKIQASLQIEEGIDEVTFHVSNGMEFSTNLSTSSLDVSTSPSGVKLKLCSDSDAMEKHDLIHEEVPQISPQKNIRRRSRGLKDHPPILVSEDINSFMANKELIANFRYHLSIMMEGFIVPEEWKGIDPVIAMLASKKENPNFAHIDIDSMMQLYAKILHCENYCKTPERKTPQQKIPSPPSPVCSIKHEILDDDHLQTSPGSVMLSSVHPPADRSVEYVPERYHLSNGQKLGEGKHVVTFDYDKSHFGPIFAKSEEEVRAIISLVQEKIAEIKCRKENKTLCSYSSSSVIAETLLPPDVLNYIRESFTLRGLKKNIVGRKVRNYQKRSAVIKVDKVTGKLIYPPNRGGEIKVRTEPQEEETRSRKEDSTKAPLEQTISIDIPNISPKAVNSTTTAYSFADLLDSVDSKEIKYKPEQSSNSSTRPLIRPLLASLGSSLTLKNKNKQKPAIKKAATEATPSVEKTLSASSLYVRPHKEEKVLKLLAHKEKKKEKLLLEKKNDAYRGFTSCTKAPKEVKSARQPDISQEEQDLMFELLQAAEEFDQKSSEQNEGLSNNNKISVHLPSSTSTSNSDEQQNGLPNLDDLFQMS